MNKGSKRGQENPSPLSRKTAKKQRLNAKSRIGIYKNAKNVMAQVQEELNKESQGTSRDFINYVKNKIDSLHTEKTATIGIFGRSGVGKSSLINAILGVKLLPSGGKGDACTAVITKITANPENEYRAEIEFITKEAWEMELKSPLDDDMKKNLSDKISALYGKDASWHIQALNEEGAVAVDELMKDEHFSDIPEFLSSSTKSLSFAEPSDLFKDIQNYIRNDGNLIGSNRCPKKYYWPVVKTVTIRVPNCQDYLEHLVLLDLPGVGDTNVSRNEVWKKRVKDCSAAWIATEIHRAACEKEAWEILKNNIRDLGPGGECRSITFICTKSDNIDAGDYMSELTDDALKSLNKQVWDESDEDQEKQCILHRNEEVKKQIKSNFINEPLIKKNFPECKDTFKVFTVSVKEYNKKKPMLTQDETEIPRVKELLKEMNEKLSRKSIMEYVTEAYGILSLMQGANNNDDEKIRIKREVHADLNQKLDQKLVNVNNVLSKLSTDLREFLSKGVQHAVRHCEEEFEKIVKKLHHKTLKAVCQNCGYYQSNRNKKQVITDLNGCLADMLSSPDDYICIFCKDETWQSLHSVIDDFSIISNDMTHESSENPVYLHMIFLQVEEQKLKRSLVGDIQKKRKELHDDVDITVRAIMREGYEKAAQIKGDGSQEKMKKTLLEHIDKFKTTMYKNCEAIILRTFQELTESIVREVDEKPRKSMERSLLIPKGLCLPDVSAHCETMKSLKDIVMKWGE